MGQDTEPETEVLKRTRDTREYAPRLRRALASTGGVHDGTKRETVELASGTDGVGPHIVEGKPVTDGERGGQPRCGGDTVDAIARRPPHACSAHVRSNIRGVMERAAESKHARMHNLMVEHDAVEGTIDALIDVVW